jgi:cell division protein FtsQ
MSEGRASLFSATPAANKNPVEAQPWVEHVTVRRMWPSHVEIDVQRREAYALRRDDGAVAVLNANGAPVEKVAATNLGPYAGLPVLVGKPAGASAHELLLALENMPSIRTRMDSLVRVGNRRWNMKMKSGTYVALPQTGETEALETLAVLQDKYALLDRPLARIDLREPGQVAVLPRDTLAGGPGLAGDERAMAGFAPGA